MVLAALMMVMAACSDSGTSTPTLAPGPTAPSGTVATTTTQPPSTTSPTTTIGGSTPTTTTSEAPTVSIPLPNTAGETNFEVIWMELIDYHNWAYQNPELADPNVYISQDCECFEQVASRLAEYVEEGWHETSPGIAVHDIDVDVATSTFALMTVIDEHSPLVVVDADGAVIEDRERRPKTFYDVRVRLTDRGWRIAEWFIRGAIGDAEG